MSCKSARQQCGKHGRGWRGNISAKKCQCHGGGITRHYPVSQHIDDAHERNGQDRHSRPHRAAIIDVYGQLLTANLDLSESNLQSVQLITNLLAYACKGPVKSAAAATADTTDVDPSDSQFKMISWLLADALTCAYSFVDTQAAGPSSPECKTGELASSVFFSNEDVSTRILSVVMAKANDSQTGGASRTQTSPQYESIRHWINSIRIVRNLVWYAKQASLTLSPSTESSVPLFVGFQHPVVCAPNLPPDVPPPPLETVEKNI